MEHTEKMQIISEELENKIEYLVAEYDITVMDLIGVLETIKMNEMLNYREAQ